MSETNQRQALALEGDDIYLGMQAHEAYVAAEVEAEAEKSLFERHMKLFATLGGTMLTAAGAVVGGVVVSRRRNPKLA